MLLIYHVASGFVVCNVIFIFILILLGKVYLCCIWILEFKSQAHQGQADEPEEMRIVAVMPNAHPAPIEVLELPYGTLVHCT